MAFDDKFDQVNKLISLGKEKGYLLYDEVNDLRLPTSTRRRILATSFPCSIAEGLRWWTLRAEAGGWHRLDKTDDLKSDEAGEDVELDLALANLDKTNDPGADVPAGNGHRAAADALRRSGNRQAHSSAVRYGKVFKALSRSPIVVQSLFALWRGSSRRGKVHQGSGGF